MTRLRLSDINAEAPVRLTVEIPARLHRRLLEYATALNGGVSEGAPQPSVLVAPIIERFIAADREFARQRRNATKQMDPQS